jgi:hypothetical protein
MTEDVDSAESRLATRVLKYWLPVLLMIGAMYYASTDVFSGENTRNVIERIVLWFKPHTREHTLQQINYAARKLAHFTDPSACTSARLQQSRLARLSGRQAVVGTRMPCSPAQSYRR